MSRFFLENYYNFSYRTVIGLIDNMVKSLMVQAEIHSEYAKNLNNDIILKISEAYKKISGGKKKHLKILNQEIIKERDQLFEKTRKKIKTIGRISDPSDIENIKLSLEMEIEAKTSESS